MRRKLVLWFVLLIAGFLAGLILQCESAAGTAGTFCLDKTIRSLSVWRTIVAASRHRYDDVSGGRAKELRKGRRVLERVFRSSSTNCEQHRGSRAPQLAS
jgi:hypothetical protein